MASLLDGEYSRMLRTPELLDGPRKNAIDALQERIEFHLREIIQLRSAQNSYVPISGLPTELLSEVFLCIVESGLQHDDTGFATGTFGFRQVCKHWNEVAIKFPQLWDQWPSGAIKAWSLFNARSKGAPISLTWKGHHAPVSDQDPLTDPAVPGRIYKLHLSGTNKDLEDIFSAFGINPPSNASSIRLYVQLPYFGVEEDTRDHLARFLPFSFPKLSKLDIENTQPDSSSPVLTTSNLTSLKLRFPYGLGTRYTLAQFSQILQKHPNLRELDLKDGAIPLVESSEALVPFALPRLVDFKLRGVAGSILGFTNLIGMSSPLHNVEFHFHCPLDLDVPALVDAVKKLLTAYYECGGLSHPRKADHLTISSWPGGDYDPLVFTARSCSTPTPALQPVLKLQFSRSHKVLDIFPLFPLDDTREFTAHGSFLSWDEHYEMLRQMKNVTHLQLTALDIDPTLQALNSYNRDGKVQQPLPKLVSLTLSRIDLLHGTLENLLDVLGRMRDDNNRLKRLIVEGCRVHRGVDVEEFTEELVEEVEWTDVEEMGSDYEGSDEDEDSVSLGGCPCARARYYDFYDSDLSF